MLATYAYGRLHRVAQNILGDLDRVEGAATIGVYLGAGTKPTVTGNCICGSRVNLLVESAPKPTLGDNDICPDGVAMAE